MCTEPPPGLSAETILGLTDLVLSGTDGIRWIPMHIDGVPHAHVYAERLDETVLVLYLSASPKLEQFRATTRFCTETCRPLLKTSGSLSAIAKAYTCCPPVLRTNRACERTVLFSTGGSATTRPSCCVCETTTYGSPRRGVPPEAHWELRCPRPLVAG